MTRQQQKLCEELNLRIEELSSQIDWAIETKNEENFRKYTTQLRAVMTAYENL